jgi:AcrR family transcriptional regulator
MGAMNVKGTPRRRRRSGEEVRLLLLQAAREEFAARGYGGATTRAIGQRAGVAEALIFRTFDSKEKLFDVAVLQPFDAFLETFTDRWLDPDRAMGAPEEVLRQFVTELYDVVSENRALVSAMQGSDLRRSAARPSLVRLEAVGERMAAATGVAFDVPVAVRLATVWVTTTAVVGDAIFDGIADQQRIVDEMVRMLVGATQHQPR